MAKIKTTNKYYNEKGEVGVLYSPGFGAGWYSWNTGVPDLLFDKDIIQAVLDGDTYKAEEITIAKYGDDIYLGGVDKLKVAWLPSAALFRIQEYDGSESVIAYTNDVWFKA